MLSYALPLNTHEAMLTQTLEQATDAMVVIDEDNRVILFNAAAEALWGVPRAQVLGQDVKTLVPQAIGEPHDGHMNASRPLGHAASAGATREIVVQRQDGRQLWASMSVSRIVMPGQIFYSACLQDITAQRAQRLHTHQLSLLADHSGSAMFLTDAQQRITYINKGFTQLFGHTPEQALGRTPAELLAEPHGQPWPVPAYCLDTASEQGLQAQTLAHTRAGEPRWISLTTNPVCNELGQLQHFVAVLTDITHTKMHEVLQHSVLKAMAQGWPAASVALLLCEEIERIVPSVIAAIWETDSQRLLCELAAPQLPRPIVELTNGLALDGLMCGGDSDSAQDGLVRGALHEHGLLVCCASPIEDSHGSIVGAISFYCHQAGAPTALHRQLMEAGCQLCALLLERERERQRIHQLAYYDTLTGLANRSLLLSQTTRMLHEMQRQQAPLALAFIDIDRFKWVNDTLGHPAGDLLLRTLAARLERTVRAGSLVARLGGDEFVAVLPRCNAHQASIVTERMLAALGQSLEIEARTLHPSASIGLAMFPEDGSSAEQLLRHADMAMYEAKAQSNSNHRIFRYRFFRSEMTREAMERAQLETDLREALHSQGLSLHYQPQIDIRTGRLHLYGVEALLRWTHPELGAIAPDRFIPLAEECGLIIALTHWVLEHACLQLAQWRARQIPVPRVAINLSPICFHDIGLPLQLMRTLTKHGLAPADLQMEITESVMLSPEPAVQQTMQAMHAHGFALSLDDFGTGYSSLSALHRLPIREIKLDRSFVQDLERSPVARTLTESVLHIGQNLGHDVVAEGVETPAQHRFLQEHGCLTLQGYLFSRPLPAADFEAWLLQLAST